MCPEIYLGVLPVTEKDGKIGISDGGKIVDYALKMKQLPQENLMSRLLEKGKVGKGTMDRIAGTLAEFHSNAETTREISDFGKPEKIWFNWKENLDQTEGFVSRLMSKGDFVLFRERIRGFMKKNEKLFEKRVREGKVRRIHGDLHSGNIFINRGRPCIFDCIEFNMRFSCLDVAADVAFLSMDLDHRNQKGLSDFFVERYLGFSKDYGMKKMLGFYRCYYAYVRGKVAALRLLENLDERTEKEVAGTAEGYFRLALEYAGKLN